MKVIHVFLWTIFVLFGASCRTGDNYQSESGGPAPSPAAPVVTKEDELQKIKYAAALVFESGNTISTAEGARVDQPDWRLYLCFEKGAASVTREFTVDLKKLKATREESFYDPETQGILEKRRLIKLVFNYSYDTKIDETRSGDYLRYEGDARGDISVSEIWEVVYLAPDTKVDPRAMERDSPFLGLYNARIPSGSGTSRGYVADVPVNYIHYGKKKFAHVPSEKLWQVLDVCEKADRYYVLQVGDEIKGTFNQTIGL